MEVRLQTVSLAEIGDTVGSPPNSRFKKSVRMMGVIQPVLLAEEIADSGEIQYLVIDGNRRIHAARRARHREVPGVVISGLSADEKAQLTLVANGFRSPNYLTEFWAIKTLERNQISTRQIMDVSGMSDSVLETRARLSRLHRDIFVALRNGRISQANAITIAKMRAQDQAILGSIYNDSGRILKRDVDDLLAQIGSRPKISTPEPPTAEDVPAIRYGVRFTHADDHKNQVLSPRASSQHQNLQRDHSADFPQDANNTAAGENQKPTLTRDVATEPIQISDKTSVVSVSSSKPMVCSTTEIDSQQACDTSSTPSIPNSLERIAKNSFNSFSSEQTPLPSTALHLPREEHTEHLPTPTAHTSHKIVPNANEAGFQAPTHEIPTIASRAVSHLRNSVRAAHLLEFSREDFLETAARIWDESVRDIETRAEKSREELLMRANSPTEQSHGTGSSQVGRT